MIALVLACSVKYFTGSNSEQRMSGHIHHPDDAILIEGERKYEHEERDQGVYRSERSYGQFRRQIPLPEGVKTDTATATFKNGVLEITMEAPLAKTRRRIQIQGEEGQKAA